MAKEELYHIALDDYEHGIVIRSLNDEKTDLMNEGKSTDAVDDLIIKVGTAPKKNSRLLKRNAPAMRDNERQSAIILSVIGIVPVVWLALLIAPSVKGGLPEILPSLMNVFNNPFHIEVCEDSVKTVLILLLCYGMGIGIYFSTQRNYRRREEHGSAKWGSARAVDKKYRQSPYSDNKLMTQNVRIGLNAKKHRRNLNTLVCGGSGAGKTRFYCKPNLMQCNTSFVILDPKGEILRDTGKLLEKKDMRSESSTLSLWKRATVTIRLCIFRTTTMCRNL